MREAIGTPGPVWHGSLPISHGGATLMLARQKSTSTETSAAIPFCLVSRIDTPSVTESKQTNLPAHWASQTGYRIIKQRVLQRPHVTDASHQHRFGRLSSWYSGPMISLRSPYLPGSTKPPSPASRCLGPHLLQPNRPQGPHTPSTVRAGMNALTPARNAPMIPHQTPALGAVLPVPLKQMPHRDTATISQFVQVPLEQPMP